MKTFGVVISILLSTSAWAQSRPSIEKLVTDQKGFFTCAGGTSAPLFAQDCAKLNLSRVSSPGSIKYEGICVDSNNKTFFVACEAFSFEYPLIGSKAPSNLGE